MIKFTIASKHFILSHRSRMKSARIKLCPNLCNLLYIDDLKVFAASESKLNRLLKETRGEMQDIGLHWNQKRWSVVHVKRGAQVLDKSRMRMETTTITALGEGKHYKFNDELTLN